MYSLCILSFLQKCKEHKNVLKTVPITMDANYECMQKRNTYKQKKKKQY